MGLLNLSDEYFMKEALKQAHIAFSEGEVPVGAVVVCNQKIIARAYNMTEKLNDVTAHAEMIAYTAASEFLGGKYLEECILYVTLEPCVMCAGASFWTRIGKIVFGASDPKRGYQSIDKNIKHKKTTVVSGIHEKECSDILKLFFESKRDK